MNPKRLEPFIAAYRLKQKDINYTCWLQGAYILRAISAVFGSGKTEYYNKPIDFSIEQPSTLEIEAAKFEGYAAQFNKHFRETHGEADTDGSGST